MNKNTTAQRRERTRKLVGIAMFTAVVIVLQLLGSFIHFGRFSVSLVLLPIVLGSAVYGFGSGTWLGFAFGAAVLISGDAADFLALNPAGTVITVILKGVLAGLVVDIVYTLLSKYNKYAAVTISAMLCPIVNTGVFLIGCRLFFFNSVVVAGAAEKGMLTWKYMILFLVGANFIFEFLVNLVLSPVIIRLIDVGKSIYKTGGKSNSD